MVLTKAVTESWNGSSWTEQNDLATARNRLSGQKQGNISSFCYNGWGELLKQQTEEFTADNTLADVSIIDLTFL